MSSTKTSDDCSICLNALAPGSPLLTLSCNHKFHLECLALNLKAQNMECPLCRAPIDRKVIHMLTGINTAQPQRPNIIIQHHRRPLPTYNFVPSIEHPVDENAIRISARQVGVSSHVTIPPLITASTTLEFDGQLSTQESNIYGLVTLKAPSINSSSENRLSTTSRSHAPIDLICIVDQSRSMIGTKMILLKQTLIYIVEQLNEWDRLAIVSFDRQAFDRSHGLKRMNQQNHDIMKRAINEDIQVGNGTFIGSGLKIGIDLLSNRRTKNPLSALLLLTDGQDNRAHDYSQLMERLPENTPCHTFGYGRDHEVNLLVQLAEQGNGGTFTYIDKHEAMGSAFAATMAGLLSCVAQQICVNIEFSGEYQMTHAHSKYKHEPERLPSSKLTFKLNDLNADENRNLLFQLHVPKIRTSNEQSVRMSKNHVIGQVSMTYIEPNSGNTLTTIPVPFRLVRATSLSFEQLRINHTLDVQRNRIETAFAIRQAMHENNYHRSLGILKAQVRKIEASVSAHDPFCQQLIKDLQYNYPTERDYRVSQNNAYTQHSSERTTYSTEYSSSLLMYQSPQQRLEIDRFNEKYTSKH